MQASHRPNAPFQRISYHEAMEKYGSDRPDLRIPWIFEACSESFGNASTVAYGFVLQDYLKKQNVQSANGLKRKYVKLFPHSLHKVI